MKNNKISASVIALKMYYGRSFVDIKGVTERILKDFPKTRESEHRIKEVINILFARNPEKKKEIFYVLDNVWK